MRRPPGAPFDEAEQRSVIQTHLREPKTIESSLLRPTQGKVMNDSPYFVAHRSGTCCPLLDHSIVVAGRLGPQQLPYLMLKCSLGSFVIWLGRL